MEEPLEMRTKQTEGELSYQDVANILWSVCFLSINSPRLARRLACALGPRALVLSDSLEYGNEHPSQMHQFFVSCRVEQCMHASMPEPILMLQERIGLQCHTAFFHSRIRDSKTQQQVSSVLYIYVCVCVCVCIYIYIYIYI